ncbi:DNA cytosine methyltransferase [Gemmatimonadota bacterium Y43]|uniref:DNA cytosine methyltransferase n=1 Tax=Gaopeijia maritima TaxID=3119007 RepID=UPI003287C5F3
MDRPLGVDLFAGAGGLSLGFEQAGFDIVAAVERDPVHAAVHLFNFPRCAVLPQSVSDVTGDDIRKAAGIGDRKVHVVFGGAPCQGFSLIGQRALDDPRNGLVLEFVRLVVELDADYFVFENVKGLTVGRHRKFLRELIAEFEGRGYRVKEPWRVLNANQFGVPQSRERLILFGAKKGEVLPQYPSPLTVPGPAEGSELSLLPPAPTCEEALGDLPEAEWFATLTSDDEVRTTRWGPPSAYAAEMRCDTPGSWHRGYPRVFDREVLTSSQRTDHTDISRRRFGETAPGTVEPISRFFRLPPDGQSNTLRAGTDSSRGAFTSPRPIHYARQRCVTVREMARLHGFPDWFRFHKTKWHGARQVGNAVPPPMARAVAESVLAAVGGSRALGDPESIELGDSELLGLGMREASEFFGIEVPISGRDRKSGAKKRKQEEIEALR